MRVRAEDAFGDERALGLETAALTLTLIDEGRAMEATVAPDAGPLPAGAVAAGGVGIWAILALALLGGLILNLMPCVLPVLSLKLLSRGRNMAAAPRVHVRAGFLADLGGHRQSRSWLLATAPGRAGCPPASAVGWGIQFQQPLVHHGGHGAWSITLFACQSVGPVRDPAAALRGRAGRGQGVGRAWRRAGPGRAFR